jgi:CBS domain-containing protein
MLSKEFLIKDVPVLKPADTGNIALSLMEDYKLKHLPIINDGIYLCLLSEKDVFLMNNIEDIVENVCIYAPYAGENTPILDVLRIMNKDKLTLLPIINSSGIYVGAITLDVLTEKMAEISNAASNGAIIAIELNQQDYDLAHIVHLTESNNSKILSLFSYPVDSTGKLVVLLKIDLEDASSVLRSLERFNYKILYYSQKEGIIDDIQRKRLDELLYYLDM